MFFEVGDDGGLDAAVRKTRIIGRGQNFREQVLSRNGLFCECLNSRPAGIAETEVFCDFIEGFPGRVVRCSSQNLEVVHPAHMVEHRIPSRREEADEGIYRFAPLEKGSVEVSFEMIDADEGDAQQV